MCTFIEFQFVLDPFAQIYTLFQIFFFFQNWVTSLGYVFHLHVYMTRMRYYGKTWISVVVRRCCILYKQVVYSTQCAKSTHLRQERCTVCLKRLWHRSTHCPLPRCSNAEAGVRNSSLNRQIVWIGRTSLLSWWAGKNKLSPFL